MQARFLLGPAGSGKTFRCLQEIRTELLASSNGPGLILLAPKQATFQLERQLLADPTLQGYTRLQILSFERLAQFVLDALRIAPPPSLNEQGRIMVLRALLMRHGEELRSFHKSARRPGFAQQLSQLLGELQQHQLTPARLRVLASRNNERGTEDTLGAFYSTGRARRHDLADELRNKLHDLALLLEAYERWLGEHELQDGNRLLEAATEALREGKPESKKQKAEIQNDTLEFNFPNLSLQLCPAALNISALWLDGFAEMTPVEMDLLAAVLPRCERAALAFCLDESGAKENTWLSIWSAVGVTYQKCRQRVENLSGAKVNVEFLKREPGKNRFLSDSALGLLEKNWAAPTATLAGTGYTPSLTSYREESVRDGMEPVPAATTAPLRIVSCATPDAEAAFAAREILKFVRGGGGRFRDAAVLVRNLESYHKPLERVFRRYEIPFFLDRREAITHHPLAELTRSALRTVAFDWQHEDWFAALKTGFSPVDETEIDRLENESLARGWRGAKWRSPRGIIPQGGTGLSADSEHSIPRGEDWSIVDDSVPQRGIERLRQKLVAPFAEFAQRLAARRNQPTGAELAAALRELWERLQVERTLEYWTLTESGMPIINPQSAIHLTVWEQMNDWLDNLELAFPSRSAGLSLREWLPILEAGLANLTVGVVPPALDQVLIGAIDRSRNPDLKLALVLGLNEGIFPAVPAAPDLLTETDRHALVQHGAVLGPDLRQRLARERYLGYIACTRASQELMVSYSRHDADGKVLNPSPFVSHLKRLFPEISEEEFHGSENWLDAEHACELVGPLVTMQHAAERRSPTRRESGNEAQRAGSETGAPIEAWSQVIQLPALARLRDSLRQLRHPDPTERLSPALAEKLFGPVLRTSVSRLEQFAACPFRFFVHSGLRAEERKLFELDPREQGSFQHEALKVFHEQLRAEGKRWRDITPQEARERVGRIAMALMTDYRDGLLRDREQSRFTTQMLTESLQDFVEVLVGWMREQYDFEPAAVELAFGTMSCEPTPGPSQEGNFSRASDGSLPSLKGPGVGSYGLPAWEIDLDGGHKLALQGRIDRVDLWRGPDTDTALCVVMDYKSNHKQLDPVLMQHGVQLQLLAYLSVLRHCLNPRPLFDVARLIPVGAFYANLRGKYERGRSRTEVLADPDAARKLAYRHAGRFDASVLRKFDRRPNAPQGDQFNYRFNKNGGPRANLAEALDRAAFEKLLENIESQLQEMGARIFAGDTAVDPYRKNGTTPCEQCDYRAICRIDPWTHRYRVLRSEQAGTDED